MEQYLSNFNENLSNYQERADEKKIDLAKLGAGQKELPLERMKTKFDIAHDLLAVLGTIKDLELEVRKLKREVEQECWQFKEKQKAENKAL